ncbi:phospholipase A [Simiduia sp. 21SJ11W-1]|uniref:phospholipase A n=1 Tax=Simiduia sp. 21SJ11W-1 TaxID=2909669 RepID=UPI00209E97B2|nr:phospholipase A [Simiduia sp. 21SJ11W-1]UTA48187.1 phospholipase A [Simiduia sp. 21SJ11W-1]
MVKLPWALGLMLATAALPSLADPLATDAPDSQASQTPAPIVTGPSKAMRECLLEKLKTASDELELGDLRASCAKVQELKQRELVETETRGEPSPVTERLLAEQESLDNPFEISAYRRNYVLLGSYNDNPNTEIWAQDYPDFNMNNTEVKLQLSFKALVARGILGADLWAAYSQQNWWQLYTDSAPFREANYEPELILRWDTHLTGLGFTVRALTMGFNHESNGRAGELSRSWNRLMSTAVIDKGNLVIVPRLWWRLPEDEGQDDNPDIDDYLGVGDLAVAYKWDEQLFTTTLKGGQQRNFNHYGVQLDWTFPLGGRFKGYVQYYNGYGESLIDYNHRNHRIGFGILLNDWL